MLLLLLWRHLDYYTEPGNMSTPPARTSILNAMRLLAATSPEQFREEVVMRLNPLLQRISSLEIVSCLTFSACHGSLTFHRIRNLLARNGSPTKPILKPCLAVLGRVQDYSLRAQRKTMVQMAQYPPDDTPTSIAFFSPSTALLYMSCNNITA